MTQFLPPNLLALFAPRDPMPFLPPTDKLPHEKKRNGYTGIGQFVNIFEDPKDTPLPTKSETKEERKERKRKERAELQAYKIEQGIALWDPHGNHKATSDPYKTLFVSRINYDTSDSKLRREFETYGQIRKITLATDKNNGKPRGYAFIEYEHERDMHAAYKHADGKKIDGRRVLVDVERGRTVKGWLPRRLGGGLGNTRRPKLPGGEYLDDSRGQSREKSEQRGRGGGGDRDRGERRRSRSRDRTRDNDRGDRPRDNDRNDRPRDNDRGGGDRDRRRRSRSNKSPEKEVRERDRGDRKERNGRDRERKERDGGSGRPDREGRTDKDKERSKIKTEDD